MDNLKISLICTVKNEEKTILDWLESLKRQTKLPDEIIVVDGGSIDKTAELIQEFMRNANLKIRLIIAPGANIAQGRNVAVRNCTNGIIASTDVGCRLHPQWLENITKPFEEDPSVDVVSGVYLPWCETEFEEIASYLIFPDIEKLDSNKFLPSGRSIAFRKKVWEGVGGYPEWLDTAEDTLFDLKLKKAGMHFFLARNAIVYWRVRENTKEIFKQHYNYAKGDGVAFLFPQRYVPRYAVAVWLLVLATMLWHDILFWFSITLTIFVGLWIKHIRKVRKLSLKRFLTALTVALAIETGVFLGYLKGILARIINQKRSKIKRLRKDDSCGAIHITEKRNLQQNRHKSSWKHGNSSN
jgi:cellulose synthase/poly-beta-1,6-N-acetylglucosamine synthase-like glycosyltransferase